MINPITGRKIKNLMLPINGSDANCKTIYAQTQKRDVCEIEAECDTINERLVEFCRSVFTWMPFGATKVLEVRVFTGEQAENIGLNPKLLHGFVTYKNFRDGSLWSAKVAITLSPDTTIETAVIHNALDNTNDAVDETFRKVVEEGYGPNKSVPYPVF